MFSLCHLERSICNHLITQYPPHPSKLPTRVSWHRATVLSCRGRSSRIARRSAHGLTNRCHANLQRRITRHRNRSSSRNALHAQNDELYRMSAFGAARCCLHGLIAIGKSGPKLRFARIISCCGAARRSCHSLRFLLQPFVECPMSRRNSSSLSRPWRRLSLVFRSSNCQEVCSQQYWSLD